MKLRLFLFKSLMIMTFCNMLLSCSKSTSLSNEPILLSKNTYSPFSDTLVTPSSSTNSIRLFNFLKENFGQKIISGVMTLQSFDETNWLKNNVGKEPALMGLDFMNVNAGYSWYNDNTPANDAVTWWNKNGIVAITWHWRDPSRLTKSFYTKTANKPDGTLFDVSKINDTTSTEYDAIISDIDAIAVQLKRLDSLEIPILWRPLHEAAGKWFWWGAKGAQPCKRLYHVMFDRLVHHHNIKNLIWVWTSEPNDQEWYPGDDVVDIIGRDIYRTGDHSSYATDFNNLLTTYGDNKILAMSECGSMPDPDLLVADQIKWSWFMPWYGNYTRSSVYNSLSLWEKVLNHPYVITLDEMPSLKQP